MALVSPGVQVTIIDESQYIPSATNSVPFILLVTAQNKVSGSGVGIAAGTLQVNANKVYLMTSQRDLTATFGNPFFYTTTAGTPINGYELNEYGLLAAYSSLGVSNRAYIQRADIDLATLTATLVRPTGAPANGLYWFDLSTSTYGMYSWNTVTNAFTYVQPIVINDTQYLEIGGTVPLQSYGAIGNYAVVTTSIYNPTYYKRTTPTATQINYIAQPNYPLADPNFLSYNNTWVQLGSSAWKSAFPTIVGTNAPAPGAFTVGDQFTVNALTVTIASGQQSLDNIVTQINTNSTDVIAANIGGRLQLFYAGVTINPSFENRITLTNVTGTPLTLLGVPVGTAGAPTYTPAPSYQMPRWRTTDTLSAATGSIWQKTNNVNVGASTIIKKYNATVATFIPQTTSWYDSDVSAIYGLDPSGGGQNIPVNTTYVQYDPYGNSTGAFQIFQRYAQGPTIITGVGAPSAFNIGDTFTISATQAGTNTLITGTASLLGTSAVDFVSAFSAASIPNVTASINSAGQIVITHTQGGDVYLVDLVGTPVFTAGFTPATIGVTPLNVTGPGVVLSNWVTFPTFTYVAQTTTPNTNPVNGTLWYYSDPTQADIMIQNNGEWVGYQNCTNDTRGDNLSLTNATGPIISATAPTTQTDKAQSPLVPGDLWIDSANLENYPALYRWSFMNGMYQWVQVDNTDQTTSNGVLFADARWAPNGTTNPITDPLPTIVSLLTSDYLDLDAPNPLLYPQGMLLWNTRRSGFNVKSFQVNYFNSQTFPDSVLPAQTNAWVTASGNRPDGAAYMGRQAQRALIVKALKSGIDSSTQAREEQLGYNLIACPQYPELAPNLVALNNERNNTAFTIIDTPLRLSPQDVVEWATNNNGLGLPTADGLLVGEPYSGAWYPSCQTTDLNGTAVVQPPSHMMIRTIIRSDSVSYPWLAPAGTRRGVVDNATLIGYIDAATSDFITLGVRQGLRDVLYENRVNPITFIPGIGITNFGNKTTTSITSALDRVNVARLIAFVRGRLEGIAKQYLFEPNDQITRNSIANAIDGLMVDLVAKRGIYDYLVVCDLSNNTPARIDRNELWVDIAIEPVKAVEFIYIPVRIKNTGAIAATAVA